MSKINIELTEDQILGLSKSSYEATHVDIYCLMIGHFNISSTLLTPELKLILEELEKEGVVGMYAQVRPRFMDCLDDNFKERVIYIYETRLEALFAYNFFNKKGFLAVRVDFIKQDGYGLMVNTSNFFDRKNK
jgi:hypothetical protein